MRTRKREKLLKKRIEAETDDTTILVYQDEVHFQMQATITRGWFKKGSAPKVKSFAARYKASYSGFVIPETGELFIAKPDTFTYETTIAAIREFLVAKPAPEGKHYVIVMDNAPWHKKAIRLISEERRPEYSDIFNQVEFLKLPPYSPDLNPIEQVWRITRKENTHNKFFSSMGALSETVNKAFSEWEKPNTQLRSLCGGK
jgi:transposase